VAEAAGLYDAVFSNDSGHHANVVVEKVRREVGAVGSDERLEFRVDRELLKHEWVSQGLKMGPRSDGSRSISPAVPSRNLSQTVCPPRH
jgi:hypothetical protein